LLLLLPFSTSRFSILEPQWRSVFFQQQATDEVRGNLLGELGEAG
jgi:hypothetical protein